MQLTTTQEQTMIPIDGQQVTRTAALLILMRRGDTRSQAERKVRQWEQAEQRAETAALLDGWSGES